MYTRVIQFTECFRIKTIRGGGGGRRVFTDNVFTVSFDVKTVEKHYNSFFFFFGKLNFEAISQSLSNVSSSPITFVNIIYILKAQCVFVATKIQLQVLYVAVLFLR